MPEDGAGVQVAAGVGGLGVERVPVGRAVVLAACGVGDGNGVDEGELVGDGGDVGDEVVVAVADGVALLVPVGAVEVGDGGEASVRVGEGTDVSEGTAVG